MERIGRYRIAGEVGRGAMGVVYRAVDPAIGRDVAIKTIRLDVQGGHSALQARLFQEARSAGVLSHPNIVTIYDMGEADVEGVGPVAYVAMGLVKGPSLEELMLAPEPLAGPRMLSILRQTAVALDYAHSRGLVHRDIKPGNIMTDEDGSVKVTDFGIARFVAAQHLNETETITGTPNYMSPEQVQGLDIDGRTDQFSLGVIAWEILTGERPFGGDNLSTVVYRIVSEDPPSAHQLNGSLTPQIDEILRRALAKNATLRFATCASFIGALETACAAAPSWKPAPNGSYYSMPTVGVNWEKPVLEPPVLKRTATPTRFPQTGGRPVTAARAAAAREESQGNDWSRYGWWVAVAAIVVAGLASTVMRPERTAPTPVSENTVTPAAREPAAKPEAAPTPGDKVPVRPEPPVAVNPEPTLHASANASAGTAKLQDIWLETKPADAKAVIDGRQGLSCSTPCVLRARPGVHQITFSLPGYRTESREVRVSTGTVDIPTVNLYELMGSLLIATTPPGASIMLNGEQLSQTTPAALTLKPGSYRVTVAREGVTRTENVRVSDRPHLLKIPLEP